MTVQKKQCPIEALGMKEIDYKDTTFLKQYLTKFNRIIPRYYSGVSLKNQKKLAQAIKRARYMALLPYVLDVKASPVVVKSTVVPTANVAPSTALDETGTAL